MRKIHMGEDRDEIYAEETGPGTTEVLDMEGDNLFRLLGHGLSDDLLKAVWHIQENAFRRGIEVGEDQRSRALRQLIGAAKEEAA